MSSNPTPPNPNDPNAPINQGPRPSGLPPQNPPPPTPAIDLGAPVQLEWTAEEIHAVNELIDAPEAEPPDALTRLMS